MSTYLGDVINYLLLSRYVIVNKGCSFHNTVATNTSNPGQGPKTKLALCSCTGLNEKNLSRVKFQTQNTYQLFNIKPFPHQKYLLIKNQ